MPILGAHLSIAGGLEKAFTRLHQIEGSALQIFTKNQRQWKASTISPEEADRFKEAWNGAGQPPIFAHDAYLINLAAVDDQIEARSVAAFADELKRCSTLGIGFLVTHPGSHMGAGIEAGIRKFVSNLDRALGLSATDNVSVLLETTAGQGTGLGSSLEEIAAMIALSRYPMRLGVCFDTCHAFAAGYDLRTPQSYEETIAHFDATIGLDKLKLFHLNDSKKDLASHVDRHEHIGKGKIGLDAFRFLLNDARFRQHPMVIETPKENNWVKDKQNLELLRSLVENGSQE